MKKKIIIVGILTILFIIGLCGCLDNNKDINNKTSNVILTDEEKIIGTWINSDIYEGSKRDITYIFSSDKTCLFSAEYKDEYFSAEGVWRFEDNKLIITLENEDVSGDYAFLDNDKTLAMIDESGNAMDFIKK